MDEIHIIAALLACTVLLLWWPSASLPRKEFQKPSEQKASDLDYLLRLRNQLHYSKNLSSAREGLGVNDGEVSTQFFSALDAIEQVQIQSGLPATELMQSLIREAQLDLRLRNVWREKSAPAYTTALVMIGLTMCFVLIFSALGINVLSFIVTQPLGWFCVAIGCGLHGLSLLSLRRIRRVALEPPVFKSESKAFALGERFVSYLPVLIGAVAVLLFPTIIGLLIALWSGILVSLIPLKRGADTSLTLSHYSHFASVLSCALHGGFGWAQSVAIALSLAPQAQKEFSDVVLRLELGLDPAAAFSSAHPQLKTVGTVIADSITSGLGVSESLKELSRHWFDEWVSIETARVEKHASRAVIPVSLFQLPAFLAVAVIPMIASQVGPLLSTFVSTV